MRFFILLSYYYGENINILNRVLLVRASLLLAGWILDSLKQDDSFAS